MFVTGSDRGGFPCEYALSAALSPQAAEQVADAGIDWNDMEAPSTESPNLKRQSSIKRGSISVSPGTASVRASKALNAHQMKDSVCESLDDALKFAEDMLIARENPFLSADSGCIDADEIASVNMTIDEEKYLAKKFLKGLLPPTSENMEKSIDILLSLMVREEYTKDQVLWEQGVESDSAKLLVVGELVSIIEDTGAVEVVKRGNIIGELGLVHGTKRLTTLMCSSEKGILYNLNEEAWARLRNEYPQVATLIQHVVIRYLAHRVQHVNNRYFHTTLPV